MKFLNISVLILLLTYICDGGLQKIEIQNTSFNSFLVKSLFVCYKPCTDQTETVLLTGCLVRGIQCFTQFWLKCRHFQHMNLHSHNIVSRFPCLMGFYKEKGYFDWTYYIKIQPVFQLNVTFIKFDMKRSFSGCIYHKLWVSHFCVFVIQVS